VIEIAARDIDSAPEAACEALAALIRTS